MTNITQFEGGGLSGLANLGNTCFINSCMQIFSHTYELNEFLLQGTYKKKLTPKPESVLLIEWDNLRSALWEKTRMVNPSKFIQTIHKLAKIKGANLFTGFDQNDASEFFMFIIDCFHTALAREVTVGITGNPTTDEDRIAIICYEMMKNEYATNYSEFVKLFFGTMVSQIISINGRYWIALIYFLMVKF